MTAKRGMFWYVDGELLCFPVSGAEVDTVGNNHRRFWKTRPYSLTGGMPYNYFPCGRIELRHGKALVYLHPTLCTPKIDIRIRHAFSLPDEMQLSLKADGSRHDRSIQKKQEEKKLDIYRFIDSRDMREHLQKLNYSFTTPEAAFLVYRCKAATLEERIAAWREIIDTMPNCAMSERLNLEAIPDFHQFLRDYIDLQERDLRRFKEPDGCVYVCEQSWRSELCGDMELGPFSDFERCLSAAIRMAAEEETVGLRIFKRPMDPGEDSPREDYCILTLQGEVCQLECREFNDRDLDMSIAFDGMWFDFPTPFHAGDILCSHRWPDEPFVLTDLCTWDSETYRREMPVSECSDNWLSNLDRTLARMRVRGDASDMTCSGYTMSGDPGETIPFVCHDHPLHNYLDLEYCRGPLKGIHKLLKPISDFLKGNRSIEFLLNTYCLMQQQPML